MKVEVSRAMLSVYDKSGLENLAKALVSSGVELVSSGGTARFLAEQGFEVTDVADVTGFPEVLGGRVKTLHPRIHAGVLADVSNDEHRRQLQEHDIRPFQLVVSNLYPFADVVADPDSTKSAIIEHIDIGGPTLVRAAAKNHAHVGIVTSPDQYDEVAAAIEGGGLGAELRLRLARAAFDHTAAYDAAIASWFGRDDQLPAHLFVGLSAVSELRYGENPHQRATLYSDGSPSWWAQAQIYGGKPMSFNNYVDAEAAYRLVHALPAPAAVVVKHTNPAGAAVGRSVAEAFTKAWEGDPLAAFGGVIAMNGEVDAATAGSIIGNFVEIVIAPSVAEEAQSVFAAKPDLRVIAAPAPAAHGRDFRFIDGGALIQERDVVDLAEWLRMSPGRADEADLRLAWIVAAHTKSNAVVLVKNGQVVGVGAGDQSRVGAVGRALTIAGDRAAGAVAASDAFFPFRDGLDALAAAGVMAVVEPGGSRRDDEVIDAAKEHGVALFFTQTRHFLH